VVLGDAFEPSWERIVKVFIFPFKKETSMYMDAVVHNGSKRDCGGRTNGA
jgi:hypothetical protein